MDNIQAFFNRFLTICARPAREPDGRPLFAYRCTDTLYGASKSLIEEHLSYAISREASPWFKRLFCLYASETWRRNYKEGAWSYSLLFNTLEVKDSIKAWPQDINHQPTIRTWISSGLQWWKRPLNVVNGNVRYLATIACEGGFPVHVLTNNQGHLGIFLRDAFQIIDQQRTQQGFNADRAVESVALRQLPVTLRQPAIYSATANLVEGILELRDKVPDAIDRVHALDTKEPQWRRRLPLSGIPDDILRQLIDPLIKAPPAFRNLRWKYLLARGQNNHWRLDRVLKLPLRFTSQQLQLWWGHQALPVRLRLVYAIGDTKKTLAHLARIAGEEGNYTYRCDPVFDGPIHSGRQATESIKLLLSDGTNETELDVEGINGLGDLPWAFAEINGEYCLAAEGSARVPGAQPWLALLQPDHNRLKPESDHWEDRGVITEVGRSLFQASSPAIIRLPDGDICEFHGQSKESQEYSYSLSGLTLPLAYNSDPIYIGVPALYKKITGLAAQPIARDLIKWKPTNDNFSPWQGNFANCFGSIWLSHRNEQGILCFRKRIYVLPNNSSIRITHIGNSDTPGSIDFTGCRNPRITIPPLEDVDITQERDDKLDCTHLLFRAAGLPTTTLSVKLNWGDGRYLNLDLPIPCKGAKFSGEGYRAVQGKTIALSRLGAVRAVAQGLGQCQLVATVQAYDVSLHNLLWFRRNLTSLGNGQSRLDLYSLQEPLESMLALTNNLDASARLSIENLGQSYATLTVAQFDLSFTPDQINNRIFLSKDQVSLLEDGWECRIKVIMVKLWDPHCEPIALTKNTESEDIAWDIPEVLEPGPWWILGSDGNWARFRPLLWRVKKEEPIEDVWIAGSLASAIKVSDGDERRTRIREVFSGMTLDSNHPDWALFYDYIQLVAQYPASSLEVLRCFAREPLVQAMSLIRSNEAHFGQVWNLAHQLPFAWHLLPVRDWRTAAFNYFGALREVLKKHDFDMRMAYEQFRGFRQLAGQRQPFMETISDWIRIDLFPFQAYPPETDEVASVLALAMNNPQAINSRLQEAMQNLQGRHEAGEEWPSGHNVLELSHMLPKTNQYQNQPSHRRPVLCAPFLAVHFNLHQMHCSDDILFDLRKIRDFDREWFDEAFNLDLSLQLAIRPPEVSI